MELSDEEKKTIREEEQRRLAQEQYRHQVRSELGGGAKPTFPAKKSSLARILRLIFVAVVLCGGLLFLANVNSRRHGTGSASILRPYNQALFSGNFAVEAGQYRYQTFTINNTLVNPHVTGTFHATGGMGNDIQVVLAEKAEFDNWINGHQAHVLYSPGKVTTGKMDVAITEPGTYCLAFSNTFSLLARKNVQADISLQYLVP